MALHEQCVGSSDEWYTPSHVFQALGCIFDVDVASPGGEHTQWIPAKRFIKRNSLGEKWEGFIWMNPPFGERNALVPWLEKFFAHGNGVALVPDRTSAPWWQSFAPKADLILFAAPKIRFVAGFDDPDRGIKRGNPGVSPAQGTCLLASGCRAVEALHQAAANGLGVLMKPANDLQ
jgi:hypothetical protein